MPQENDPRVCLVTGANRGIGLAFATHLCKRGDRVIATARQPEKARDLAKLPLRLEQLDVADEKSIASLAGRIEGEALDVLINNAGIGEGGPRFGRLLISENESGGWIAYRASKAALNQLTRTVAAELKREGFVCIAISPGWVRTDMGGPGATRSPEESVAAILEVIDRLKPADTGRFLDHRGKELPW